MNLTDSAPAPVEDPEGRLERALINEFLHARGHDALSVDALPTTERKTLMQGAAVYVAAKLTQIEARARFGHGQRHEL